MYVQDKCIPACTDIESEYNFLHACTNFFNCFCSSFTLSALVIDSYPPVTAVEQGESIVLVCRVVGVLPSVTLSYSWTCKAGTCEGTEVVSGNRLRIGVLSSGNHGGTFRCSVTGSGVSVIGTFTLTVTGEEKVHSPPSGYVTCVHVLLPQVHQYGIY